MKLKLPIPVVSFIASWWKLAVGLAVGAAFGVLIGQWQGAKAAKAHEEADRAVAVATTLTVDGEAKEAASEQRLEDAAAVVAQTEKLTNAVASLPDAIPSARRIALGCERLRQAPGADLSNLPIVCRPEAGAQAGAAP